MKILNSDSQCAFKRILVEKLPFVRPNRKILLEITYESKIVSEYDQEIPQSQIADNPVASRGRATQPSRDTRKTN